jgi:copper chaperone NosL
MTIVDPRFGAEAITGKGKQFKFDAVECMLNFIRSNQAPDYATYVTAYNNPNVLVESANCTFLVDSEIPSPMGLYLTAYGSENVARDHQQRHRGTLMKWDQLITHFDSTDRIN